MSRRRTATAFAVSVVFAVLSASPSLADSDADPPWRHGLALFGEPTLPPDAVAFPYAEPDAPRGGRLRRSAIGKFDSFNPFITRGRPAALAGSAFETLAIRSADEPAAVYGLLAEAVRHPDDFSWVEWRLRPEARWHDGSPVTARDVAWSMETLKRLHPKFASYWRDVESSEALDDRVVRFEFSRGGNRELPYITGDLIVMSRAYWEGVDAEGTPRSEDDPTLEPPMGSGPYRIVDFDVGRYVLAERVSDYWGEEVAARRGLANFGSHRVDYYSDETVAFEAFKNDAFDVWLESRSQRWATGYDFADVREGRIRLGVLRREASAPMQAFVMNLRRPRFADPRVREAFSLAFDFEWMNRSLFHGQYRRLRSFFDGSELAAREGVAEGRTREILESLRSDPTTRDGVPDAALGVAWTPPVHDSPRASRGLLSRAEKALDAAGWRLVDGTRRDARGESLRVEFLLDNDKFERVANAYRRSLERLGIETSARFLDPSSYRRRVRDFDFDIVIDLWAQSLFPGNEQRDYWGSEAADVPGSRNTAGIKNSAIDATIARVVSADSREEMIAATRVLDRLLLSNLYVVPQWRGDGYNLAWRDRFGMPKRPPRYDFGYPATWWSLDAAPLR